MSRIIAPLLYVAIAGGAWTYHQLALRDSRLITAESVAHGLAEQQRVNRSAL